MIFHYLSGGQFFFVMPYSNTALNGAHIRSLAPTITDGNWYYIFHTAYFDPNGILSCWILDPASTTQPFSYTFSIPNYTANFKNARIYLGGSNTFGTGYYRGCGRISLLIIIDAYA